MSWANAFTWALLDFDRASCPALMSIVSATLTIWAIWASFGLAAVCAWASGTAAASADDTNKDVIKGFKVASFEACEWRDTHWMRLERKRSQKSGTPGREAHQTVRSLQPKARCPKKAVLLAHFSGKLRKKPLVD